MSVEMALACWRGVRDLAGPSGQVHLTGGEPFEDYERLEQILQGAQQSGLEGLEKIETNAYWCTDEELVRRRLLRMGELGLTRLQISTDVYHQEYISIERVRLGARIAQEVLGPERVQIRWRDFLTEPILVGPMKRAERAAAFRAAMGKRRERLLGRAAKELSGLLPSRVYDDFADINCKQNLLGARHVHIDGNGNVFSGTCMGIILGKVGTARHESLDKLWQGFDYREHPIVAILVEGGPGGLITPAERLGYQRKKGYASKCHLCYEIRRFLYQSGKYGGYIGPSVCYGLGTTENGAAAIIGEK